MLLHVLYNRTRRTTTAVEEQMQIGFDMIKFHK